MLYILVSVTRGYQGTPTQFGPTFVSVAVLTYTLRLINLWYVTFGVSLLDIGTL